MPKNITSLLLIAVLAGSFLARTPVHAGLRGCSIETTTNTATTSELMDCCPPGPSQVEEETSGGARTSLFCAMHCSGLAPGERWISSVPSQISSPLAIAQHPAAELIDFNQVTKIEVLLHPVSAPAVIPNTKPTYIRHHALLI